KVLNFIEVSGNRLPDPAVLFLILLIAVWFLSWPLSYVDFNAFHPVNGDPILVKNQVTGAGLAHFFS
ncbi:MAG: AbgT family transporter, partial [Candidatus Aminicenantes bacterium]|nr:AbgT family transporter [Gammaproteobacteria bacterium]NIO84495.1 AbgT family transporter [Candidatus Aminicenantes bacterium]NIQ70436.1 AbgT family transporter [Candidatus Aminicenantes bacterium]NIT26482.1 AbgT family transporter [Candidatus Aminicenantes bacterium]